MSRKQASSVLCPPESLWVLTDLIMDYMHCRFHAEMETLPITHSMTILPDINIPTDMVCEVDRMADMLVRACNNPERCTHLSESVILIVESGKVITWYLPAAVSPHNQVLWESLEKIKMSLPQSIGQNKDTKKWRTDSTLFWRDAKLAGVVNLSLALFQQGHSASAFPTFSSRCLI
ncbi:hypothetical protein PAXRUDRAFT_175493 [Paxillus rubicundulus Ve08.2h10]|uniref:Uncharacterized protein n=1 Tax=Paxillus rubicundulus Ve08.2h10 TaxID=930991 RepID=A0A0D0BSY1_9AGAM|nr:hypothetical protein PAXRUDRAFT_175493 [Paxillus rubicundulus Ve08.2h10]